MNESTMYIIQSHYDTTKKRNFEVNAQQFSKKRHGNYLFGKKLAYTFYLQMLCIHI